MPLDEKGAGAGCDGAHPQGMLHIQTNTAVEAGLQGPNILDTALALGKAGFRVFPILPNSKTPAIPAWNQRASYDPEKIRGMFGSFDPVEEIWRFKNYNVGIAMGRTREGFAFALDVDIKNGAQGHQSLADLELLAVDNWLDTKHIRTWSGGDHFYFLSNVPLANTASKLGPGLDTRGEGGFVVAPGSIVDGKPYIDLGGTMRPAPHWLVQAIGAAPADGERSDLVLCTLDTPQAVERATAYLLGADPAIEGMGGNSHSLRTAARVKDFGLSEIGCLDLLYSRWNERCVPPWEWEELAVIVSNAYRYGKRPIGVANPEADFEALAPDDPLRQAAEKRPKRHLLGFDTFIDGASLMTMEFQPPKWAVEGLLPEGLTIVAGKPKIGKSWLTLEIAEAVSQGGSLFGRYACAKGAVLLLALEDSPRRLQDRLRRMEASPSELVSVKCSWPNLAEGGLEALAKWLDAHPNARAIIIDTLARVKPRPKKNASSYDSDSHALAPLQRLAVERGIAIILVHHDRKSGDEDWLARISGSLGLSGVSDTLALLTRKRGSEDGILHITGRDVEEMEIPLRFDSATCRWQQRDELEDDYGDVSPDQAGLLRLLSTAGSEGLATADICASLGKSASALSNMLKRLREAGLAKPIARGRWCACV